MENIKFKIFGSNWIVKFKDNVTVPTVDGEETWAFGTADPAKRIILVSTKDQSGAKMPAQEIRLTILHEIMHAFLMTGQYMQSNQDEPLVEWLARCVNHMIESNLTDKLAKLDGREKREKV